MSILGQKDDGTLYWDLGTTPSEKEKVCTGPTVTDASNYVEAAGQGEVADITVCDFADPKKGCSDPVALNFKKTVLGSDTTLNNTCRFPMFEVRGPNGATKLFKWEDLSAKMKAYHLHQMGIAAEDVANDEEDRPFEFDPQIMLLVYVGAGLIGLGLIAYMYKTSKSKK